MIKRIAHVCLNVKNLDASVSYYTQLGFKIKFWFTREGKKHGIYLEIADGNYIEIFENPSLGEVVNNGINHFCLETDDMDSLIENLEKKGIPFTQKMKGVDHTYQIWLADPDGNRFEVHGYTQKSSQFTGEDVEVDW
ncbi:MAG: VOC family protein [Spirochaetales bacterium]|nr:VOC family protein [Spirochaetales bacterium]